MTTGCRGCSTDTLVLELPAPEPLPALERTFERGLGKAIERALERADTKDRELVCERALAKELEPDLDAKFERGLDGGLDMLWVSQLRHKI